MASLSLLSADDEVQPVRATRDASIARTGSVVVASFGDPVAADYAATAGHNLIDLSKDVVAVNLQDNDAGPRMAELVLFLPRQWDARKRAAFDGLLARATEQAPRSIVIVSTFRVHLGNGAAVQTEAQALDRLKEIGSRVVVFRPGHVLSAHSPAQANLRRFAFLAPLVPRRIRSCCVEGEALFAAINRACAEKHRPRVYTVLGPNRPWQDWLHDHRGRGLLHACLTAVCYLLSWLLVGQLAAIALDLLARWFPALKHWNFETLKPCSLKELLELCNPYNAQHVKVVGYNNGVVHFGHRYRSKTVVSTVLCNRIKRVATAEIQVDCGATIRQARDFLGAADQELYVVPNYSYVCLGTAFFVPIHGSASDYATVAESITRVLLYDPQTDRLIRACSDEPAFRDHVYNMTANVLLLRLCVRVKPRARYFVQCQQLDNAGAEELLYALQDTKATNVEIRKSKAWRPVVEVSRYYQATNQGENLLEIPRDSLGQLWDRLEENALTSFLMHALTRWFAWHVELFFTADEFKTFWETHQSLPLRKIQLRYIRRDGLPHSAFREHDCVSVDLFMFRWNRKVFETFLKRTFAVVRSNPGKHSQ